MPARYWLFADSMYFDKKYIPTLAQTPFTDGIGAADPAQLVNQLTTDGKNLLLPDDNFLVVGGTTDDLKKFRQGLVSAGVDAIDIKTSGGSVADTLVTWCLRIDVNHPDKKAERNTTVTLLVIGGGSLFKRYAQSSDPTDPEAPWQAFPQPRLRGAPMMLDDGFDAALDEAREFKKVT